MLELVQVFRCSTTTEIFLIVPVSRPYFLSENGSFFSSWKNLEYMYVIMQLKSDQYYPHWKNLDIMPFQCLWFLKWPRVVNYKKSEFKFKLLLSGFISRDYSWSPDSWNVIVSPQVHERTPVQNVSFQEEGNYIIGTLFLHPNGPFSRNVLSSSNVQREPFPKYLEKQPYRFRHKDTSPSNIYSNTFQQRHQPLKKHK